MKKAKKAPVKKEIEEELNEMTDSEMEELLVDFSSTRAWEAYKKYIAYRQTHAEQALYSIDPFKNPTETARNQGIRMGLMDLDIYITELKRIKEEKSKPNEAPVTL